MNETSERLPACRREIGRRIVLLTAALAIFFPGLGRTAPPAACQEVPGANATTGEAPEAHLGKGYDALKLDRYDVAVSEFRAALEIDPKLVLRARFANSCMIPTTPKN
jgi:hypothetical protein